MRRYVTGVLAAALCCLPLLAQSQPEMSTRADTVTYHQQSVVKLRDAVRRMKAAAADLKAPLPVGVRVDATSVLGLARLDDAVAIRRIQDADIGQPVWKEPDRLRATSRTMVTQAESLVRATELGDLESFRAALTAVAQACAACHLDFRIK